MEQSFQILPHPLYPIPTQVQFEADPEGVRDYLVKRNRRILLEREDPFHFGFKPPIWALVEEALALGKREILILGGNRATKSYYGARKAIEVMLSGEKKVVWCLQTTYDNSIEMQQVILYHYIPLNLKDAKKGKITNISYSQKTGFSDGKFIFPNGSECVFRNYSQKQDTIEGGDVDFIWCDELVPLNWIETLRYRLLTRGGKLLITFTPIQGWTPTIKEYLDGAKTLQWIEAPLLAKGTLGRGGNKVPRIQQPQRENARIVYFHTADNPFSGYENLKETLAGAPKNEILCRAYGVPTRSSVQRFPRFKDSVHVVAPDSIPKVGTRYQIVDPAANRNWFMIWVLVSPNGAHYVYREWPSPGQYIPGIGDPGPWAEADGRLADGRPGPAQTGFGWGLRRYLEEIERLETVEGVARQSNGENGAPHTETIVERWMDSRFGNAPNTRADASTTIIEEMQELGATFMPAPLDPIEEGVSLINSMLDYDRIDDETLAHPPHLYISENCQNVVFALKIWSGKDGAHGATKDPIDCLRYMAVGHLVDFDPAEMTLCEGGAY